MTSIDIDISTSDLSQIEKRQVPYALARTLTGLAWKASYRAKAEATQRFIVRRPWMMKGFRWSKATKQSLEASVFHRDEYMAKQEYGGVGRPVKSRFMAVPKRQNPRQIMRPAREALNRPATFIAGRAIYQRPCRGPLRRLYSLVPQGHYKPRLGLAETVEAVAREEVQEMFSRYLAEALGQ